jgi:hypothetical protein
VVKTKKAADSFIQCCSILIFLPCCRCCILLLLLLLQVHALKQKELRKMLQQGLLPLRDGILQVSY